MASASMDGYEQVRDDVLAEYREIVTRDESELPQVGLPGVEVSASQPAWLGRKWRIVVLVFALLASASGLVLVWWALSAGNGRDGAATWVVVVSGVFSTVALIIAYLTVGGFGQAQFSVGRNADQAVAGPGSSEMG